MIKSHVQPTAAMLVLASLACPATADPGRGSTPVADSLLLSSPTSLDLDPALVQQSTGAGQTPAIEPPGRLRSYELPAMTIEGDPGSSLREEQLVGSYRQPRWTTARWIPSTRVYVIPEGKVEVEYWYRPTFNRDGTIETRMLAEVEVGLPYRFQLDFYLRTDQVDAGSDIQWGGQFEVRWALADWGRIWGNPTLYLEYIALDGRPDRIEPKLLLGGEIPQFGEGWHWGVNFVAELEINGRTREHEFEFTSGISRTIIDSVFAMGAEFKCSLIDEQTDRGHYQTPFLVGPTFQWHPVPRTTINLETLVGFGAESPYGQITVNFGFEF